MPDLDPFNFARAEAAPATAEAEPIAELIARWRSNIAAYGEKRHDHTDQEVGAFTDEVYELVTQMAEKPAVNMRDLAAKAEVARHEMLDAIAGGPIGQDQALILSLFDDIERIAGAPVAGDA